MCKSKCGRAKRPYPPRQAQEELRILADTLERVRLHESSHDVQLARFLADMLDKPRVQSDTATLETALQLIADMQISLENCEEV